MTNEVVNSPAGIETALGAPSAGRRTSSFGRSTCRSTRWRPPGVTAKALDDASFRLHLGRADGRFAVNCGAGVDAAAMRRLDAKFPKTKSTPRSGRVPRGRPRAPDRLRGSSPDLSVQVDDREVVPLVLSVMVGRTDPYTYYREHGIRMTPEASLSD